MTIQASTKKRSKQHRNEKPLGQRRPMTDSERKQAEAAFAALQRERTGA